MHKFTMIFAMAALLMAGSAFALTDADLTPAAVNAAMKAKPATARSAYAQEVFEAIAARPTDEATKIQQLTQAARAAITGAAKGGGAIAVIAQVYNTVPVDMLQGVSDLLTPSFSQSANKMDDAAYDAFCQRIVRETSAYIETSGTDSPTVRTGIVAATFTKGSNDPERTRAKVLAVLPASLAAAAPIYLAASERGDTAVLAAGAGVDEVGETPADPDTPVAANDDYLNNPQAPDEDFDDSKPATVPILARLADDALGMNTDTLLAVQYGWETGNDPLHNPQTPFQAGAAVTLTPGSATDGITGAGTFGDSKPKPLPEMPSPLYGNQR